MHKLLLAAEASSLRQGPLEFQIGDTVDVHTRILEGGKERIQIFEGLVIKTGRAASLTSTFTVRRVASGVGVEKTFLIHSPSILKVEVVRRSKVRRNRLNYMRQLSGRSTRLSGVDFDREAVNAVQDDAAIAEEERIHEEQTENYDPAEAEAAKAEAKAAKAEGSDDTAKSEVNSPEKPSAQDSPAKDQNKQ